MLLINSGNWLHHKLRWDGHCDHQTVRGRREERGREQEKSMCKGIIYRPEHRYFKIQLFIFASIGKSSELTSYSLASRGIWENTDIYSSNSRNFIRILFGNITYLPIQCTHKGEMDISCGQIEENFISGMPMPVSTKCTQVTEYVRSGR